MLFKYYKVFLVILLIFYQNLSYSKNEKINKFDSKSFANYFSAVISYNKQENSKALKFFDASKQLGSKHQTFLVKYINSLVLEQKVNKAIKELKNSKNKKNLDFFEANLLLLVDALTKKDYKNSYKFLNNIEKFKNDGSIQLVIYETLREYIYLYKNKEYPTQTSKFRNLSSIIKTFQSCYLSDHKRIKDNFINLINDSKFDSSRYIFFYLDYLVDNNKIEEAKKVSDKIDVLNSNLLISQSKNWLDQNNLSKYKNIFSCKKEKDNLAEFFFLIANLYFSEENIEKSNFYFNISNYLNPKFKYNLGLLVENYYYLKNYEEVKKILNNFNKNDDLYYWFKIKKLTQIISKKEDNDLALNYLIDEIEKIKNPSIKILLDTANIFKQFKEFELSINYYNQVLTEVELDSLSYADIIYRRGGSFERIGDYTNSDKDLLKSLELNPDNAYALNYLAYAWLERDYRIDEAIKMLKKAHELRENDPFILDSLGWAYYLTNNYLEAEDFLRRAIEIMPDDPILNDHYGDILWKLNRKIQAKYFWENVLSMEDADKELIENINSKILKGLQNT